MTRQRFDPAPVMARLKDFQRRSVDYIFRRMYLDEKPAPRFLVADEVGLGKTLVARGLIARALEHLDEKIERIDVIYVCSNAAIAAQNLHRLNVAGREGFNLPTRLTLLPKHVSHLKDRHINFVSFTPGTTFDLKSSGGVMEERSLIYRMLQDVPWLDRKGFHHVMRCTAGRGWDWWTDCDTSSYDQLLAEKFREQVVKDKSLRTRIETLCETFHRANAKITWTDNQARYDLVGDLRRRLGALCLAALEPDLVILDEFQRFRDLLDGEDEAADLARQLFDYPEVRVLLLSATPYKMLALDHEEDDDHYPDFLRTLGFLFHDPAEVAAVQEEIRRFRRVLFTLTSGDDATVVEAQEALQSRLRRVMCRTERVGMTAKLDAMVGEPLVPTPLAPLDLTQAASIGRASRELGTGDAVEYWKSSPYLLNFLKGYEFRRRLEKGKPPLADELVQILQKGQDQQLRQSLIKRYKPLDPANARMRALFADTLDRNLWRVLWMPPSMPYMTPSGAFAEVGNVTKSLVFSSWNMVPDAIATVCSYEAERRMVEGLEQVEGYESLYDQVKPLLKFTTQEGRQTGMPALALLYPSPTLAELADPLKLALSHEDGGIPTPEDALVAVEGILREHLAPLMATATDSSTTDQRWYWAAPILLDAQQHRSIRTWCENPESWHLSAEEANGAGEEDDPKGFVEHVQLFARTAQGELTPPLGRPPEDLARVLSELALAAPGVCALRALHRVAPAILLHAPELMTAAAHIADGFRTLYNLPESIALLRGGAMEDTYWRTTLAHGLAGNLQALLDEQVHVLQESLGLLDVEPEECVRTIALDLGKSLSLRIVRLGVEEVRVRPSEGAVSFKDFRLRCRFALRFADIRDDENQVTRADTVRAAFNSPFRPFVLASTSIGQEGLDFHVWCHAVMHWNLPSNPVDLEQREGRVHRYKGHAVRKNIARRYGVETLKHITWDGTGDPWRVLFDEAVRGRPSDASDLVPYWIFEVEGGACVERRVPILPFSREVEHLKRLKKSLALYRLVFGQPRQEDLLAHLAGNIQDEAARQAILRHRISLAPIKCGDGD